MYKPFQGSLQTFFFFKLKFTKLSEQFTLYKNLFTIDKVKVYNWKNFLDKVYILYPFSTHKKFLQLMWNIWLHLSQMNKTVTCPAVSINWIRTGVPSTWTCPE